LRFVAGCESFVSAQLLIMGTPYTSKLGMFMINLSVSRKKEATKIAEVSRGESLGKPRVKVADKSELLRLGGL
jgi:hypothetical protein